MKTALLLIDIQNDYFPKGANPLIGIEKAANNAAILLNCFREKEMPVFHIQHISIKRDATFFLPNTNGVKIYESVLPLPSEEIIQKYFPNAFRKTLLFDKLKAVQIDDIVICGAMSHMCVDATTRAAFDLGFSCTVISDACATKDLTYLNETIPACHVHGSFMAALGSVYAEVRNTKDFTSSFKE